MITDYTTEGTLKGLFGKTFRAENRWAKVTVIKLRLRTIVSCAFGDAGNTSAFDVVEYSKAIEASTAAKRWVQRAVLF